MLKSKAFLAILSGVLLSLSWPTLGFPYLIFFAFVPLFIIEKQNVENAHGVLRKTLIYSYLAFFIWNLATTWWIWNSTEFGAIVAIILNSFFMALVWLVFSFSKKHFYNKHALFLLPVYWIGFEYFHLDWDLSWSWLNLGNVFANHPYAIQWYEYTGTFGGSWWILLVNILIFKGYEKIQETGFDIKKALIVFSPALLLILLPLSFSLWQYNSYQEKGEEIEVLVVQPNMDPWSEQFLSPPEEVINRIIDLSTPLISEKTRLLLAPESAIQEGLQEPQMSYSTAAGKQGVSMPMLYSFLQKHPQMHLLIGASTYRFLDEPTATSRTTAHGSIFDEYNSAIYMNGQGIEGVYHKSKLVPGPEKMPFKKLLSPLQNVAFDLGGTVGSLGSDTERKVFYVNDIGIAPLICYESIYGGFVAEFVRNGAQILAVITNDGWWGNTQGHQQHLAYARLRAIECRRSVARSANTGISAFINQRGDIIEDTPYWKPDARLYRLAANSEISVFVRYGDFLGRMASFLAVLLLLISFVVYLKKDKPDEKAVSE